MPIRIVFLFLFCSLAGSGVAQIAPKKLKADAERYYKNERYPEALNLFLKYQRLKSTDSNTRLKIGHCLLENNKAEDALRYFEGLIASEKKVPVLAYYFKARALHVLHHFQKAAMAYKVFLAKTAKKGHDFRDAAKDALLRCVNGFNQREVNSQVIVENLGDMVNGRADDFAPVLSPNHSGRIYFTSVREGNVGGRRLPNGTKEDVYGKYKTDMFVCEVQDAGHWGGVRPLNPLLNSAKHDKVLSFNSNGKVLYYFSGMTLYSGEVFVDTFGIEAAVQRPLFYSPMMPELGDTDLFFFNDTTMLFSSDREGGYGGKDIYICSFRNGQWGSPVNLGPVINSVYDEVSPFLAADGRTLYFSSNNMKSLGDLDIFRSRFQDGSSTWSEPENLGIPFNSAREDAYFKLSKDGMNAFFSSSRIESVGQRDIYIAYYSTSRGEQRGSNPPLFTDVLYAKKESGNTGVVAVDVPADEAWGDTPTQGVSTFEEVQTYRFPNLHFGADGVILTKDNKIVLEEVAALLKKYPTVKLELISHTAASGQAKFDLYFSAKRAREVLSYLKGKGCPAENLYIRACGANYPIAKNHTEGGGTRLGDKWNRRIELIFHRTNGLPIQIETKADNIPSFIKATDWKEFKSSIKDLSYKIQIADIKQMYNGDLLTKLPHPCIETSGTSDSYQYTVGLFRNFSSARVLQLQLLRQQVNGAFVVPYINGLRASINDAKVFATAYPDLYNYLRTVEK